jgi:hypothetical protein
MVDVAYVVVNVVIIVVAPLALLRFLILYKGNTSIATLILLFRKT